jgi:hypothetical protein
MDVNDLYLRLETLMWDADWEGRDLPAPLKGVINRLEVLRAGDLPNANPAATAIIDDAIHLFGQPFST